jgi:hypothetical protein
VEETTYTAIITSKERICLLSLVSPRVAIFVLSNCHQLNFGLNTLVRSRGYHLHTLLRMSPSRHARLHSRAFLLAVGPTSKPSFNTLVSESK